MFKTACFTFNGLVDDATRLLAHANKEQGEYVINITVGRNPDHCLAPTWALVNGLKKGTLSWEQYREGYLQLLRDRYPSRKAEFLQLAAQSVKYTLYLACFCRDPKTCHRSLAVEAMAKVVAKVTQGTSSKALAEENAALIAQGKKAKKKATPKVKPTQAAE